MVVLAIVGMVWARWCCCGDVVVVRRGESMNSRVNMPIFSMVLSLLCRAELLHLNVAPALRCLGGTSVAVSGQEQTVGHCRGAHLCRGGMRVCGQALHWTCVWA